MNRINGFANTIINLTDPTGLFNWCTGQIEQGDYLLRIALQGSRTGASQQEVLTTMSRIIEANPIITDPNYIGFTWPPLNIPNDIKAWGQINTGTFCGTSTPTTSICGCPNGYAWRADWQTCVPILETPPPPLPYDPIDQIPDWYYRANPCDEYFDRASSARVLNQVYDAFPTGRYPTNLGLPRDVDMGLYDAWNRCMVQVYTRTGFTGSCAEGAFEAIVLDIASLYPPTAAAATIVSVGIAALQVLAEPDDVTSRQGFNRAVGGTTGLAAGQIERLGSRVLASASRVIGGAFAIGDAVENARIILQDCFGVQIGS